MIMKLTVGDKILTKKPHPCGCSEWTIVRLGADVKIKCNGCGRMIMLSPTDFERRLKKNLGA